MQFLAGAAAPHNPNFFLVVYLSLRMSNKINGLAQKAGKRNFRYIGPLKYCVR